MTINEEFAFSDDEENVNEMMIRIMGPVPQIQSIEAHQSIFQQRDFRFENNLYPSAY